MRDAQGLSGDVHGTLSVARQGALSVARQGALEFTTRKAAVATLPIVPNLSGSGESEVVAGVTKRALLVTGWRGHI
jgi:hypothetical protein